MEQDKEVIRTISKDIDHISNKYLVTQKIKKMIQPNDEHGNRLIAEEEKRRKVRKI